MMCISVTVAIIYYSINCGTGSQFALTKDKKQHDHNDDNQDK